MGVYDTLMVACPYCGKPVMTQTKCLNNEPSLKVLKEGSAVDEERSILFVAKEPCSICEMPFALLINKGKILGAVAAFAMIAEHPFGEVESEVVWKGKPNLKK